VLTLGVTTSEDVRSSMDHACWTTDGEVRRVGPRAGRFIELENERESSWRHWFPKTQVKCVLILYMSG